MSKTTETINYSDYALDPTKDVLMPPQLFSSIDRLINAVITKHSEEVTDDVISYFNKKTHKKLSNKNKAKMSLEKLNTEYYQNIDFEETEKTRKTQRDGIGLFALRLLPELREVFKYNIDNGNKVERPDPNQSPKLEVVEDKVEETDSDES